MASSTALRIQVGDLLKRVGSQRSISVTATLRELSVGLTLVDENEPVEVETTFERIPEGVVVRGSVATRWHAPCSRCLQPTGSDQRTFVDELFEADAVPGETYALDGEILDLEPMVRDAIVLELPQAPLCADDCAGLCPNCGVDRNTTACSCVHDESDPRWAALGSLEL